MKIQKEQLIKQVQPIGNGAHIFVPRKWIGEEAVIIKRPKPSLKEQIMSLIESHIEFIEGVYLFGSHVRNEASSDSDVDILIISNKKLQIKKENWEIICLEKLKIPKAIRTEPIIIYSALAEAATIINAPLLKELREKYIPSISDFNDFFSDTKRMIRMQKQTLYLDREMGCGKVSNAVVYSLFLRLRGIFIIDLLLKGLKYSHTKFRRWIIENTRVSQKFYDASYQCYKDVKGKQGAEEANISPKDIGVFIEFLGKETLKLERWKNDK